MRKIRGLLWWYELRHGTGGRFLLGSVIVLGCLWAWNRVVPPPTPEQTASFEKQVAAECAANGRHFRVIEVQGRAGGHGRIPVCD